MGKEGWGEAATQLQGLVGTRSGCVEASWVEGSSGAGREGKPSSPISNTTALGLIEVARQRSKSGGASWDVGEVILVWTG